MKNRFSKAIFSLMLASFMLGQGALAQDDDAQTTEKPTEKTADNPAESKLPKTSALPLEELQMFAQVFGKIKSDYVDVVDDKKMLLDAIKGILAGLDPHSAFLEPDAFREMRIDTEGEFGGVGIEITLENKQLRVISPIDGTPAMRAGVKAGDIILKIDGVTIIEDTLTEAVDKMRGKIGTKIILTIGRKDTPKPFDIEVIRDIIQLASVRGQSLEDPGYAYMRISSFQSGTAESLQKEIQTYQADNGEIHGLILDLRNNPGGILTGAIDVSDLFLDTGVIVKTHGRLNDSEAAYEADSPDLIKGAPMVVLVNNGSASASEIVAGALQDHQRAIIFGTQTFGKGSVQTISPMGGGNALKITTARYFTPNGRSIQETGITPDIISEATKVGEVQSKKQTREVDLNGHLVNPNNKPLPEGKSKTRDEKTAKQNIMEQQLKTDSQLRDALNLLKGINLANTQDNQTAG